MSVIGPDSRIFQQAVLATEAEKQGKRTIILCATRERAEQIRHVLDLGDRPLIKVLVVDQLPRFITEARFVSFVSIDDPRAVAIEGLDFGVC